MKTSIKMFNHALYGILFRLMLILILLAFFPANAQDHRTLCFEAIIVSLSSELPFEDLNQYTCGRWNDYENTCLNNYDGGEEILYQLDVDTSVVIDICFDPQGTTFTGIALTAECPPEGSVHDDCIAVVCDASSDLRTLQQISLESGTYYLMIDTWPAPECIPAFDLVITASDIGEIICGDANGDDAVNILDITFLIAYLYTEGPAPNPIEGANVNNDGSVNILDITYLITYLYSSGPDPICP